MNDLIAGLFDVHGCYGDRYLTPGDATITKANLATLTAEVERLKATRSRDAWHDAYAEEIATLTTRLQAAERDRDLAIAHDSQPYPTTWAYDQACAALAKAKGENERLRANLARAIESIEEWAFHQPGNYEGNFAADLAKDIAALSEQGGAR